MNGPRGLLSSKTPNRRRGTWSIALPATRTGGPTRCRPPPNYRPDYRSCCYAVKKLSLFESDTYPEIFPATITADDIVFADLVKQRVDAAKDRFPEEYRKSWILVSLIAVYLVGQLIRADEDLRGLLEDPAAALQEADIDAKLDSVVRHVAGALQVWHNEREQAEGFDNFKVEFKNEVRLRALSASAQAHYLYARALEN
jgi:hypothetical protein